VDAGDWLWVWIGAAVLFAFLELVTPFLFFMISFAAGAAFAAVAAALDASVALQFGVFIAGSGAALLVLVPVGRRLAVAESDDVHEGAVRQIGRVAVVLEQIPAGRHDTGLVRLERQQWRAETDADATIEAGAEVEVIAVRGTRLVVAPVR
jgi:membrane protein implicated in regulation of membrane protease activity